MSLDYASIRCPSCNHRDIHQSNAKGLLQRLGMALILRKPVRCYDCYHRFTVWSFLRVKTRVASAYEQKRNSVAA
jgi:ribosomal protein S27E